MTDATLEARGRCLITNGYLIVPIRPGHKRPALEQWQSARLGVADLGKYPRCGVGILTGQGAQPVVGIDIDTTDEALAQRFTQWCHQHLGNTCERIGNAPKRLLVYRAAEEGWGKTTGAWYEDIGGNRHRLEVLAHGQQFVAYHIHPDTQRPYEWVDLLGGLAEVNASELPVISADHVEAAMLAFDAMAEQAGLSRVAGASTSAKPVDASQDLLMAYEPPVGISLDDAIQLLQHVDPADYDTWLRVGMSLHHEFDASGEALDAWDTWSAAAGNYQGREDLESRWQGFGASGRRPTTVRWLIKVGNQGRREAVKEGKIEALREVRRAIYSCGDSLDLLGEVARKAGEIAGSDLAIKVELVGLLRAKFKDLTGMVLPVADVRLAMAAGHRPKAVAKGSRYERTEFGNAARMLDHYGTGLMFVPEQNSWYAWTGVYWRKAAMVELEYLAKETIKALPDELSKIQGDDEREAFFKFCAISQRAQMVTNMLALAKSDPRVVVPFEDLDKHHHLLGVANGVVDLRSGRLLPSKSEYRITTITQVEYDPEAAAPLWERTVAEVFNDNADMIAFFQRLVGYALLGKPDEDVLVIPYGTGSNGKSTVLGAIREVLGGHAKTAKADTFLNSDGKGSSAGNAREDVLRLRGARFVYVTEPEEGSELREGLIKSMTGGEPMPARALWSSTTVEVMPTWVTFMPTNHRPIVKGDDHAIWRRLLPVPFTRNFDTDLTVTKDTECAEKLKEEGAGILRWCVQGALLYVEHGLKAPKSVRQAREEYRGDMDLLADWLAECCELDPNASETSARLWASWEGFARARGELQLIRSSRALMRRIASRFEIRAVTDNRKAVIGVKVKTVGDF